jgi:DNA-binding response OmpR family regulator
MTFQKEPYHILAIDDSPMILRLVSLALEDADFKVTTASSGEEGLEIIQRFGLPHLALVDINMPPGMDGFEFCEKVLEFSDLPIVMLTAIDHEETIIQAIDQFAEDYITKPFNNGELVSRIRRVLRRIGDFGYTNDPVIKVDHHLSIDLPNRIAVVAGDNIPLTPTEAKILYILVRAAGRTVTTDFLMRRLWPLERVGEDRLRVNIHRVRKKIEANEGTPYIISERGIGYAFVTIPTTASQKN